MISITTDLSGLTKAQRFVLAYRGRINHVTAYAMNDAGKAAKQAVADRIFPLIEGGPTNWTRRGLIHTFAKPSNLQTWVGFHYGAGSMQESGFSPKGGGIPSGRYMGLNARGGDRRPKSSELQLRRSGVIRSNDFITPAKGGVRIDARGNVSGPAYQQMVSRLRGFTTAGSNQNSGASKRGKIDYFIRRDLGAAEGFIAKRAGRRPRGNTGKGSGNPGRPATVRYPRGFVAAFWLVDQPNYERRFPIQPTIEAAFNRAFPPALRARVEYEMRKAR
jgi:hypothetical protein